METQAIQTTEIRNADVTSVNAQVTLFLFAPTGF